MSNGFIFKIFVLLKTVSFPGVEQWYSEALTFQGLCVCCRPAVPLSLFCLARWGRRYKMFCDTELQCISFGGFGKDGYSTSLHVKAFMSLMLGHTEKYKQMKISRCTYTCTPDFVRRALFQSSNLLKPTKVHLDNKHTENIFLKQNTFENKKLNPSGRHTRLGWHSTGSQSSQGSH